MIRIAVSLSHDLAHRLTRPAQSLTLFHHLKPTCAPSACYRPQSRPNFRQYSSSTSSSSSGGGGSGDSWLQRFYLLLGAPWRGFRLLSRNKTARRMFSGLLWLPAVLYFTKNFYSVIRITGGSMSPSLNPDATQSCDIVLTNKLVTQDFSSTSKRGFFSMNPLRPLQIGDVVIMISPLDPTLIITKRILALGGDIVSRSSPAAATSTEGQASDDANEQMRRKELIRIAPAHVWVEGDANTTEYRRDNDKLQIPSDKKSRDSREFGPIPVGLILARVDYILWPLSRFGKVPPRPHFDLAGALRRRADRKERVEKNWSENMSKHLDPSDSALSTTAADWEWVKDGRKKDGEEERETSTPRKRRAKKDEELEATRRDQWNSMSRGGQMGRDAGREEWQ